ncbi:facilitated trehalose transporter Tret1 [Caerostris extrusa]|uniref:Facilitated trehalose transporter Tret1 n=1 Tax=Caerostris extrusa TaxID=172846 RepID=A0AAV4XBZ8_CAEEX|nr:facilitated trehalose transporter Tret1 [Caerostris extrusa]
MFVSTIYTLGWLAIAYAPSILVIYLGRIISGLCAGICAVAVPTYIVEIAPTEIRGLLTSGFQVAFSVGVFLIIGLGTLLRWSWLAIAGAVLTTSAVCLMVIMPGIPRLAGSGIQNREFLNPTFYKPLGFAVLLMVFQQTSGVNSIMSYTVDIFGSIGSSVDPHIASAIVAAVQIAGTIV